MKKYLCMILSLMMALCCASCKDNSGNNSGSDADTTSTQNSNSEQMPEQKDEYKFVEREIKEVGQTYQSPYVKYPDELWTAPKYEYCPDLDFGAKDTEGVKAIFFDSPITWKGKPTKVFAYMGFPEGASKDNKVPAIVLIHGAGGTAVPQWVHHWNQQGFAAIAIDTEGAEPTKDVGTYSCTHIERNRYADDDVYTAGPSNSGFGDVTKPLVDQYQFHATSAAILAVSLIRSFDCVDPQKVGMTGLSAGGVVTAEVIGYDDRISFAMPVYNVIGLSRKFPNEETEKVWGDLEAVKQTNCKVFNVASVKDTAYDIDANSRFCELTHGFCLFKTGFPHGHEYGSMEGNLPFFARYFCGMESEFVEVMQNPTRDDPTLKLRTYGDVEINSIKIYYTDFDKINSNTIWESKSIKVIEDCLEYASIPVPESKYAYVQIKYNKNLEVSTYLF